MTHHSGEKRKWDDSRTPYDGKQYQSSQHRSQHGGGQHTSSQRGDYRSRAPQCNVCSKYHFGECRHQNVTKCYKCGGNGHFSRECPSKKGGSGSMQNDQGSHQQSRAPQSESRGNREQPTQDFCLQLERASHSFISDLCVNTLSLPVSKFEHKMVVSSPVGGTIEISNMLERRNRYGKP
ncbi:CCHC-type zinc finger protein CG3800-like [Salvia splendens]|uniref:CCHC-type zinc finger protein CG3800-like n=1 Tax=Salvia splendens TaxID=180675 RepID=UPI001C26A3E6|nr:CCHC-type zinc finger protein CG3800-like [Salvia splendens]